jgi:hypothetical protein
LKVLLTSFFLCASLVAASAQAASQSSGAPRHAASVGKVPATDRSECVLAVGLCVTVPASWQRLGDVFGDLGFVVAEPHPGVDTESWPLLTVAAIDVSPQQNGSAPSLDSLVETVLTPGGSFTSETLQRTHLLLNGSDAEIVRIHENDEASKTDLVEAVALIEGNDGFVYSIALRCAPQEFTRLEAVFQKAAHSWRIKPSAAQSASRPAAQPAAQPSTQPATPSQPAQDSTTK